MKDLIPTRIVPSVECSPSTPRQTEREFKARMNDGMIVRPVGTARDDLAGLLSRGYGPKHKIELFDTTFYLTNSRQNEYLRFFVAYVVPEPAHGKARAAWPRIFYKDVSLVWRTASHITYLDGDIWIGKGEVTVVIDGEDEILSSDESTTDLPLELQNALESLNRLPGAVRTDHVALDLVLRRRPGGSIEPFADFTGPRQRAVSNPRNRINGGRSIARFQRRNDPTSLVFTRGFEPDFEAGILDESSGRSSLYGGPLRRFRILSRNRKVQYQFMAGPRHAWIIPPQATTTELSTYGLRTINVQVDEDLCVPGFEYHFMDDSQDPPALHTQIPPGFAGPPSEVDESRADASAWLDRLPVIQEFRRKVL